MAMPARTPPPVRRATSARWRAPGRYRPPSTTSFAINVAVRDVMSRNPITIRPNATLFDALVLMRGHKVSGLPVVDRVGKVVGVLSHRDVARMLSTADGTPEVMGPFDLLVFDLSTIRGGRRSALRRTLEATFVRDAMSSPAISVPWSASLELAAGRMRENEINRLPVLRGGRLVGIVTRNDLVRALVRS